MISFQNGILWFLYLDQEFKMVLFQWSRCYALFVLGDLETNIIFSWTKVECTQLKEVRKYLNKYS